MGAIAAILFGLFLLGGFQTEGKPVCPPLRPEYGPIYEPARLHQKTEMTVSLETLGDYATITPHAYVVTTTATTTIGGRFTEPMIQVGEGVDEEAIEHNKKVKECQIINGEF
jgi:hypothetical protein